MRANPRPNTRQPNLIWPTWLALSACLGASIPASATTNQTAAIQSLSEAALDSGTFPFSSVVLATTGQRILLLNSNDPSHVELTDKLKRAAARATTQAIANPIEAARPNEAGTRIEKYVKAALTDVGLEARTPVNARGRAQSTGYPDIEIPGTPHCYLELKTYSATALNSSQRTFYYSPSETPKVAHDALHFLLAFQLEKESRDGKTLFIPTYWQLVSLEGLQVEMKLEFNQSNRGLYGDQAGTRLIGEGTPQ